MIQHNRTRIVAVGRALLFACLLVPGLFRAASAQATQTAAQAPGVEFDAIDGTDVHEPADHGLPFPPIILELGVVIVVAATGRWATKPPKHSKPNTPRL